MRRMVRNLVLLLAALLGLALPAAAADPKQDVQVSWRLLDYIGVDYREAVAAGKIVNALEYEEMVEFSANVSAKLAALPDKPAKPDLVRGARQLEQAIAAKAEPTVIASQAKALAGQLLAAYPVPLAPARAPDLKRGAALYADNCASCHGGKGEGPAPAFAQLDPPPIAFADRVRARDRSVFGLYQVVTQGLEETAMQSYA